MTTPRSEEGWAVGPVLRRALSLGPVTVVIAGRSMLPTYRAGESVRVEQCGADDLVPGDVVLLEAEPLTLHRYVGRSGGGVVLAGDGNRTADPLRDGAMVLGRVIDPRPAPRFHEVWRRLGLRGWARRIAAVGVRAIARRCRRRHRTAQDSVL